jgi:outer membrane lipoprotein carrier protein
LLGGPASARPARGVLEAETAREVLARLDARLAGIRSLRGRFVQTFLSAGLGVPQEEEGVFYMQRPDRLRWEYRRPEEKTAVSDGTHTWLYLPEERVVYRGTVSRWKAGGGLSILVGGRIADEYEVAGLEVASAVRDGNIVLRLEPRADESELKEILLEIEPRRLDVAAVTAVDLLGNRTAVTFSDVEENARLRPGLFEFSPPRGARLVDQEEGEGGE